MKRRPAAIPAVCVAVAALSVLGALDSYQISSTLVERRPDPFGVASAETRFAAIAQRTPPTAVLTYISDLPMNDAGNAAFLAAQHALAPRTLLLPGMGKPAEYAVGNFAQAGDFTAAGVNLGYDVVQDFGRGAVLYRRRSP
jgi:hypothetical protein